MSTFLINAKSVSVGANKATKIDQPFVAQVWFALQAFHLLQPVVSVSASVTNDAGTLTITLLDGRAWTQTIANLLPDPVTAYVITGLWKASEEARIKPLRDALLMLLVTGQVDSLAITL